MQAGDSTSRAMPTAPPKPPRTAWYDTIRPLATLGKGWNRIPGRFGTGCAHDSTFAFKVRPGLPDKLLIFLNGWGLLAGAGVRPAHQADVYHDDRFGE